MNISHTCTASYQNVDISETLFGKGPAFFGAGVLHSEFQELKCKKSIIGTC
jgi:hypothetical protein